MSTEIYPTLAGLTYDVKKTPRFSARNQDAVSGRQLRILDTPYPIWKWELQYSMLRDMFDHRNGMINPNGGPAQGGWSELRTIMGFFLARRGSFDTFLFDDSSDNYADNQQIGSGDGTTTQFQLVRSLGGGFNEPVLAPNSVEAVRFDDNMVDPSLYSVNASTGLLTFTSAPSNGVVIRSDFSYYFRCHFADGSMEFNNFMYQLWELKKVVIESVLI